MHFLKRFSDRTISYDLINKFIYNKTEEIPGLRKITLSFDCKIVDRGQIFINMLALKLITQQKSLLTKTKYPNLVLKIKRGDPVSCQLILTSVNILDFLDTIFNEVLPKIKDFDGFESQMDSTGRTFCIKIEEAINFLELENNYHLFQNLLKLNVAVKTNAKENVETLFLLHSFLMIFKD